MTSVRNAKKNAVIRDNLQDRVDRVGVRLRLNQDGSVRTTETLGGGTEDRENGELSDDGGDEGGRNSEIGSEDESSNVRKRRRNCDDDVNSSDLVSMNVFRHEISKLQKENFNVQKAQEISMHNSPQIKRSLDV